ncbi:MAG TPA: hypothetical protein VFB10_11235 [Candidatus Dormibacteraeota bacterium]|nr:hypothetical protein [Candidatus Dormibacteraeota bacterium]
MQARRAIFATALSCGLMSFPAWGAPTTALGTVIAADRAHVGEAKAEVGTTVYGGDSISTELQGSVQLRAGKARLLLLSSSSAVVSDTEGSPAAKLLSGTATFSTGNANAFTLFACTAAIRAQTDAPTIGRVSYIGPKELLVHATRGALVVTVDTDNQIIPEGTSYRVLLDQPEEMAQGPAGAGSGKDEWPGGHHEPRRAGRNRFLYIAGGLTAVATYWAVSEALESAQRP